MAMEPCYLLSDNPLKDSNHGGDDPFQFKPFVDTFVSLAMTKSNSTPFTVVIDGPWGSGKSTMMQMTKSALDSEKQSFKKGSPDFRPCKTFWFNAWKYSNDNHLLAALLLTIFKDLEKDTNIIQAFKTKISGVKAISGLLGKMADSIFSGSFSDIFNELRVEKNTAFLDEFISLLKMLIQEFCCEKSKDGQQDTFDQKGAFVIFIDDLDRCPPSRVLQIFEAIKLFLDIPGCIFFLGMEVSRIVDAVDAYAEKEKLKNFEASRYIEKIIQVHVKIPPVEIRNMTNFADEVLAKISFFKKTKLSRS